ncbi:hypothetical protein [Sphingomonas sp.]|uniref:hypothetical protein n=1 Tax=Sphingomonas sp. TaxID=28214 RepID=UPI0025CE91FD|nr:hypothetical protein [Sphingomonas sp.]MBV9527745.1 hypothetical protein [Sphingomonas sp.]
MRIIENGNLHTCEDLTPDQRPQDPSRTGRMLRFTPLEHDGDYPDTMPQALRVADRAGHALTYVPSQVSSLTPEERPQDDELDGRDLAFTPLAWGTEHGDDMPEQIAVSDRGGRSCVYEPIRVNGRAVISKGYRLLRPGEQVRGLIESE